MADITKDPDQTKNTPSPEDKNTPAAGDKGTSVTVNIQGMKPEEVTPEALLETEVGKALAAKLRTEEKDKLHGRLEKTSTKLKALEEEKEALLKKQEELDKKLRQTQEEQSSASKDVETQLAELRAKLLAAEGKTEVVMTEAKKLILQSELKAYRERAVNAARLTDSTVIPEGLESAEAIDEAIKLAQAREQAIREKVAEELRNELGGHVPSPLAPQQENQSPAAQRMRDPKARRDMAGLSQEDYDTVRNEMLKEATKQVGWPSPR